MWEMLEVTHEGTEEVRRARKHALVHEYEMLKMQPKETISQFQTRFTHIVNHLLGLGKTFDDDELNVKVLKSLPNVWLPKVIAIRESKDLTKMSLAALFSKLLEYETDATNSFEFHDESNKKHRNIALKATRSKKAKSEASSSSEEEDENLNLIVRRFRRFLTKKNPRRNVRAEKKDESPAEKNITCFECGKRGHIKTDCAVFLKKQLMEKRSRAEKKDKSAYIAWDQNSESSASTSGRSEEEANLCLMINAEDSFSVHTSDTESEHPSEPDIDKLVEAFNEMHQEAQKLAVSNNRFKSTIKVQYEKLVSI